MSGQVVFRRGLQISHQAERHRSTIAENAFTETAESTWSYSWCHAPSSSWIGGSSQSAYHAADQVAVRAGVSAHLSDTCQQG